MMTAVAGLGGAIVRRADGGALPNTQPAMEVALVIKHHAVSLIIHFKSSLRYMEALL
jgi:hypothetical protein